MIETKQYETKLSKDAHENMRKGRAPAPFSKSYVELPWSKVEIQIQTFALPRFVVKKKVNMGTPGLSINPCIYAYMCVYMPICIYAYMRTYMRAYMHICAHICTYVSIYAHIGPMYAYMRAYMHVRAHICIYACIYAYMLAYMDICVHICIYDGI